jgi:hypothetical protein
MNLSQARRNYVIANRWLFVEAGARHYTTTMIRRHAGDQFYLIAQNDHAQLSGRIASHYGNHRFARPKAWEQTLRAIAIHDAGWVDHDEAPTLDKQGRPLDVFETPLELSLRLWHSSVARASNEAEFTQLLVSLHVMGLSGLAALRPRTPREVFELNKFQQREIERQEIMRRHLGLPVDAPLRLGLSERPGPPAEEELKQSHQLMQIGDRLSLALCCTTMTFGAIEGVRPGVGGPAVTLKLTPIQPMGLRVEPWPFAEDRLKLAIPYRAVPARRYADARELQRVYGEADVRELAFDLLPAG